MVSLTVAIPFRSVGCAYRDRHFNYVREHLKAAFPEARHVVVDTVHEPYNRAAARNEAMRAGADSDVVLISGADYFAEPQAMRDAVEAAANDGRLHKPFTEYRASSRDGMEAFYQGVPFDQIDLFGTIDRPPGGIFVMRPDRWFELGGMDERFTGWGYEDTAFMAVIDTLAGGAVHHDGTLDHLWHPEGGTLDSPMAVANKALFDEYAVAAGDLDAMRALIAQRDCVLAGAEPNKAPAVVTPKRKLRVAFVAHGAFPFLKAGSETMMHGLARAVQEAGHSVVVCGVRDQSAAVVRDGIAVLGGGEARRRWRNGTYDVVVTHHAEALRVIPAARQRGVKSVLLVHSDGSHIIRQMDAGPSLIVYNTHWVREAFGRPGIVVHPPVRPEDHATTPGNAVTLVNLNQDKGAELFYELARRLPDVQFLGVRGGHGAQIIQAAPNVTILDGTADMKRDVWSLTSVLLMPSLHESYGLAGMEAMASGIPVIAHPTTGLREALGDAGVFIDRADVDGWEAHLRLLLAYPDRMKRARDAAKARVDELNTGHELVAFVDAIERLAAGEKQAAAA